MLLSIIQFITIFLLLLVTGVFWGPWLALHRTLNVFSKEEFLKITHTLGANLGRPMQVLMPVCLLSFIASAVAYPDKSASGFYLILASFFFFLLTLIVTLTTELPIVNQIRTWTPENTPADWESIRDKWVRFHAFRVFPAMFSFGLYVAAILHLF